MSLTENLIILAIIAVIATVALGPLGLGLVVGFILLAILAF